MPLFHRLSTSGHSQPVGLEDQYAGPFRSTCWLIGGGPSLATLPIRQIAESPCPKMAVNLAGHGLLRPTFWTSYDPTVRFHRSIYLDAGITKFVHRRRAMDLVPDSSFKVCECPATYFFDRETGRGFDRLLDPLAEQIVDWNDSFVQALDLLYRLGFRRILLAGCDLQVRPAAAVIEQARCVGVEYQPGELLQDFFVRCARVGLTGLASGSEAIGPQYHFAERKPAASAIATDAHYFRIAQYLRLSRRCLALRGMELISVTPESRLNGSFPYRTVKSVLQDLRDDVGDPAGETTQGRYVRQPVRGSGAGLMRDFRAPNAAVPTPAARPAVAELVVAGEGWQACVPASPVEEG